MLCSCKTKSLLPTLYTLYKVFLNGMYIQRSNTYSWSENSRFSRTYLCKCLSKIAQSFQDNFLNNDADFSI